MIIVWYRPPSALVSCFSTLDEDLHVVDGDNKDIILLHDTHCDVSLPTPSVATHISRQQEIYNVFGFRHLIQEPTGINLQSSSLIDHICTSEYLNILK